MIPAAPFTTGPGRFLEFEVFHETLKMLLSSNRRVPVPLVVVPVRLPVHYSCTAVTESEVARDEIRLTSRVALTQLYISDELYVTDLHFVR